MIFLRPQEHILDYISRVKELRAAILDAERRETETIAPATKAEIDLLTGRSFCKGLPLEYRLQMKEKLYQKPFEAFSVAKTIAKEGQELDKTRFGTRERQDRDYEGRNYTRRQLTPLIPPRERYNDPRSNRENPAVTSHTDRPPYGQPRLDRSQGSYPRAEYSRNVPQYPDRTRNDYPY